MASSKVGSIIGWICIILVAAFNLFAAIMKFVPQPADSEGAKYMADLGISTQLSHALGIVEFVTIFLFLYPRTSTIGFVLMVGYFGGVLATLLTHGQDPTVIYVVFALLTIGAYFRNPELLSRARGQM